MASNRRVFGNNVRKYNGNHGNVSDASNELDRNSDETVSLILHNNNNNKQHDDNQSDDMERPRDTARRRGGQLPSNSSRPKLSQTMETILNSPMHFLLNSTVTLSNSRRNSANTIIGMSSKENDFEANSEIKIKTDNKTAAPPLNIQNTPAAFGGEDSLNNNTNNNNNNDPEDKLGQIVRELEQRIDCASLANDEDKVNY